MCSAPWYKEFFDLNGAARTRRDLVVAYAESKGGVAAEYLRRRFPSFWRTCDCPGGSRASDPPASVQPAEVHPSVVGASLGLTSEQEVEIVAGMFAAVLPRLRSSPGYKKAHEAASLRLPPRVRQPGAGR